MMTHIRTGFAWAAPAALCACLSHTAVAQSPAAPANASSGPPAAAPSAQAAPAASEVAAGALPAVEDLAPKSTFLAVGVKDLGALVERFSSTPLAKLILPWARP